MKKHISSYIFGLLSMLVMFISTSPSFAQSAGELRYNSGRVEYCNGIEWISTDSGMTNGSCSTPAEIRSNGGQIEFCDGSVWKIINVLTMDGACDNTTHNGCTAGTANDGAYADTATHWRWRCDGINGGANSGMCSKLQDITGVCNNSTRNACSSGFSNPSAYADTSTQWRWRCDGQGSGSDSAMCSKMIPVNGSCNNSTTNACSAGTPNDGAVPDTSAQWRWRCDGQYGGSNSGTCAKNKPVDGSCNNSTRNGCSAGSSNDGAVADTGTHWRWRCDGLYGGSNSTTCSLIIPINGVCNNGTRNACSAGTSNDGAVADTTSYWRWRCDGQYGGSNSGTCAKNKPVNGVCNNATRNACSAGSANDGAVADDSSYWRWRCDGQYGGSNSGTCQKAKPAYTYSWQTSGWSGCSANATWSTGSWGACSANATWSTGGWSACSANATWSTGSWSGCSANATWSTGGWGACSAPNPTWSTGSWSACSVSCGGGTQTRSVTCPSTSGTQTRTVSCPSASGTQTRTVSCPSASGTQTRTVSCPSASGTRTRTVSCPSASGTRSRSVWCERSDGATVSDGYCGGGKPSSTTGCTDTTCSGSAPASSQGCTDTTCSGGAPSSSRSCTDTTCSGGAPSSSRGCTDTTCSGGAPSSSRGCTKTSCSGGAPASSQSCNTQSCGGGGGGGSCFVAGTMILMADGSEKAIEDIVKGDMVMAFDQTKPYSKLEPRKVNATLVTNEQETMIINGDIQVTESHKFPLLDGRKKEAGELQYGDMLIDKDGNAVLVRSLQKNAGVETVYNFEVDGYHTYVANGIRTRNMILTPEGMEQYKSKYKTDVLGGGSVVLK